MDDWLVNWNYDWSIERVNWLSEWVGTKAWQGWPHQDGGAEPEEADGGAGEGEDWSQAQRGTCTRRTVW